MPTSTINLGSVAPVSRVSQQAAPMQQQMTPLTDISMSGINPIGVNASVAYGNTGGQGSNVIHALGSNLAAVGLNDAGAGGYGGAIVSLGQGDTSTAAKQAALNYIGNETGNFGGYGGYVGPVVNLATNGVNQQTVNASANTAFWTYLGEAVGDYFGMPGVGSAVGGAIGGLTTDMGLFNFSFAKGGKVPNPNIMQAHLAQLRADLQRLSAIADRLPNGAEIAAFIQQHFVPILEQKKAQGDVPGMIRVLLMMRAFLQQNIQNAQRGGAPAGGALGAMAPRPAMGPAMPATPPGAMAPRPMAPAAPVARPAPVAMAPRPVGPVAPAPSPLAQMQGVR